MNKVLLEENRKEVTGVSIEDIVKEALSYDLASNIYFEDSMHSLQGNRKITDINSKEEKDFSKLLEEFQNEKLEAARVAISLVYDKINRYEKITTIEFEQMASIIHDEWLKRNNWVFECENTELAAPYSLLPREIKEKNRNQLTIAILKVTDYARGHIDIDKLIEQYKINVNKDNKVKKI